MYWYINVITKNYSNFKGRASRKEYWMFILFFFVFSLIAGILDNILGLNLYLYGQQFPYGWIYLIFGLAHFIPMVAVLIRRLHDVDKSGWWILYCYIPYLFIFASIAIIESLPVLAMIIMGVGYIASLVLAIMLLVFICSKGNADNNKYGIIPESKLPDKELSNFSDDTKSTIKDSDLERLEKLGVLRDKGHLSDEEFANEKQKIFNS